MSDSPTGWHTVELETVADIRTGLAKNSKRNGDTVQRPYLRVANVQDGFLDLSEIKEVGVPVDKVSRYSLQHRDVLFTEGGDFDKLGRGCVWYSQIPGCLHQNHVFAVSTDQDQLLPEYLAYYAASARGRDYFLRCAKKSTNLASINSTQLREMPVRLPPVRWQLAFLMLMKSWEDRLKSLGHALASAQRLKASLMRDLLSGRRRFPEFQNGEWFDGHVGDVMQAAARPTEWDEEKVYRLASVRRWAGGIFEREHLRGADIKVKSLFHLEKDDILLSHIQAAYGAIARVPEEFADAYVSSTYSVLIPRDGRIDPVFAEYLFSSRWMWHQAYLASNGFFAERLRLCFNEIDFLKRPISIPANVKEQWKIAEVLETADREIKLLEDLRDAIERQKRGLMQRLLTGEMTLPKALIEKLNAEAETETALQQIGESS